MRERYAVAQEFSDTPTMRHQSCRYRRSPVDPFLSADDVRQAEALVFCAKVVDSVPHLIFACVQARICSRQGMGTSRQATEATAESAVEPFDVRRIDVASALRSLDDCGDHFTRT